MNGWQFVIHQEALEKIDSLSPRQRREIRATLLRLVDDPWQRPDAEIRPPNDRIYLMKNVRELRVLYWLDAFAREVYVVRVDQPK